ncbi:hypothetical protein [Winogradskyella sp.]|uniref:hypothetical protein n=1 Tax=Winogradskyella sp. TaxID=1883156 RepID=UPI002637BDF7|nr:hypothetical protein [Winogradskyella sp.]
MKKILIVLLLCMPSILLAQKTFLDTTEEAKQICDAVMQNFVMKNINVAYDRLKPIAILNSEDIEKLKSQTIEQEPIITKRFGQPIDFLFVKAKEIEGVFIRYIYVLRHERYALRFQFDFYRGSDNKWGLSNFMWDDGLRTLLDEF